MQAPELDVREWFNTDTPLTLDNLKGRVVVIEAFQMLCPGCVLHGIPLAQSIQRTFSEEKVAVIGLHTVFEHHNAMTPVSLQAFLHEYRIAFPVGVDKQSAGSLPNTMSRFGMRGTPSLVLLDQAGQIVAHHFGQVSELQLGSEIGSLLTQEVVSTKGGTVTVDQNECKPGSCNV
ncbi:redoxin domain-containing protein [uncultured Ruegeria sp.]|uniref:redoxin domain-containing protein n=1 Tax=uncultured Ruegeria sp. TaxID=259304 RepID=UPI00262C7765|nr:redoxin domain-containing protein [uncultured Ruegeria sp.]